MSSQSESAEPPSPAATSDNLPKSPANADELLWESPTAGPPLNLAYLPPGIQGIVAWRPGRTYSSPDTAQSIEAFARWSHGINAELEARIGVPLGEIDQLLIGFLDAELTDAGLGLQRMALVVRTAKPLDAGQLLAKWGEPKQRDLSGKKYFEGATDAWYLPDGVNQKCLVVTPVAEMPGILERDGAPPTLRRELDLLLAESDSERLLTLVFPPSFLVTGGKSLLVGELVAVCESLDWFLADQALAVLASIDVGENLFFEARIYTKPDMPAARLEYDLRKRLKESSSRLEQYLALGSPTPYGQEVLSRFPSMWRVAVDLTRTAHQDRQVILRTYLPRVAAQNLALATSLALSEVMPSGGQLPSGQRPAEPQSIEDRLRQVISLSSPRQTLEQSIEAFGRETGIAVEILGPDLQLDGITKNQSFALDATNLPAVQVLEKILGQASPDGRLIYIIKEDPDTALPKLYITTRSAAARRGDKIPEQGANRAN